MTLLTKTIVGPSDHGRRMTLDEFDTAEGVEGRLYELSRGEVVVTDVPNRRHCDAVDALRQQIAVYRAAHPGVIQRLLAGNECKILVDPTQSERHPDLAVYKTPPPGDDSSIWSVWVPELVVEVVSADSAERDYVEKAEDYLRFGVLEYWIVDAGRGTITALRRSKGRWQKRELRSADRYTTHLLPGFELDAATLLPS
jgi:Uma2 family endonuclease